MTAKLKSLHARTGAAALWMIAATALPALALETYQIDSVHSSPGFKIRHLFSHTTGRFTDFSGTLQYDAEHPERSRIEITIQTASIDTDNERRDEHLRSADFFDVATHPTITFRSTRIDPTGEANRYRVTGDFTLLGVTRPILVDVELLGLAEVPGMGARGGFSATTTIDRKAFGMQWNKILDAGGTVLGNDVTIDFPIEIVRVDS
jgi:polyisoprenoid-binding protein YceI